MYRHKDGIRLKKLSQEHLPLLLELKEESWWGTHGTLIINTDDQLRWYQQLTNRELYMVPHVDELPVGIACYTEIDWLGRCLNISGSIFKPYRRDEIVKPAFACGLDFAFEILNMQRVSAEVLETHLAAQQLEIGFLGFKVEGRKRKAVYKAGWYYDSLVLGLLREEWEQQERVQAYGGSCNLNFSHEKALENLNQVSNQA